MIKNLIVSYIIGRLKEASTWRGIIVAIMGAGLHLAPQYQKEIGAIGVAAFTALSALPDSAAPANTATLAGTPIAGIGVPNPPNPPTGPVAGG